MTETINLLLSDIQELEKQVGGMRSGEELPARTLAHSCRLAHAIAERLQQLEAEHMQQMETELMQLREESRRLEQELEEQRAKPASVHEEEEEPQARTEEPKAAKADAPATAAHLPAGGESLNEALERQQLSDFRRAFSLNDRFRFCRALFNGNDELMNQTIADLNAIPTFDEAIEYIDIRFHWSREEETAKDFVKLLEKRYL